MTPGTRQFYLYKLAPFVRWCEAEGLHALHELTAHHIRRYLISVPRRNLTSQYQHNIARAIRTFVNYCVRDELIEKSSFDSAINCLRNGMNVYVLARLMGHADITILRQYLPLLEADYQDAPARFGAVDNLLG